jgi:hypothetical protein
MWAYLAFFSWMRCAWFMILIANCCGGAREFAERVPFTAEVARTTVL